MPIATAQDVVEQLLADGEVERAYLGISGGDITAEIAEALDLRSTRARSSSRSSRAAPPTRRASEGATGQATVGGQTIPAGGDIITEVDGKAIAGMEDVISTSTTTSPATSSPSPCCTTGTRRRSP